jgi:hypothetical protein
MPKSIPIAMSSGGTATRMTLNGMPASPRNPNVQTSVIVIAASPISRSARSR